jgi:hypothetical protein
MMDACGATGIITAKASNSLSPTNSLIYLLVAANKIGMGMLKWV